MKKLKKETAPEVAAVQEKKKNKLTSVLLTVGKFATAALVLLVLVWFGFTCEVREGNCAVIMRFGAVRQQITEAGVYMKLPWPFETVVTYDNRIQYLESDKLEAQTNDKRNIMINSYVFWKIDDPVKFHNSVGAQGMAETFIKGAVDNATNKVLGSYKLSQLVSKDTGEIKNDEIQAQICASVQQTCQESYGITISDVRFLRLSLPDTNLDSVFQQMTADRQKEIDAIIAEARLQASQITTDAAQESAQIIAEGVKEAAAINAETETEVAKIYAEAQSANIELFQFLMNLDAMASSINDKTVLVVKADEYPFNVLTQYSQNMTLEDNATVVNDLSYILSQLPERDRQALVNAISQLIRQAANRNGVPMN